MKSLSASNGHSWASTPTPLASVWLLSASLLLFSSLLAGSILSGLPAPWTLVGENGPVETLQIAMLGLGACLYLFAGLRSSDAKAAFCLLIALALVVAIRRELPGCGGDVFEGGACLTRRSKLLIPLGALACTLALLMLKTIDWKAFARPSNLRWVWPIGLAGVLLAAAAIFEGLHLQGCEELLETAAYLYGDAFAVWLTATTFRPWPAYG